MKLKCIGAFHGYNYTWLYMVIDEKLQCLKLLVRNVKLCVTMHFNFEIIDLEMCMKLKCIMPFTHAVMQIKLLSLSLFRAHLLSF